MMTISKMFMVTALLLSMIPVQAQNEFFVMETTAMEETEQDAAEALIQSMFDAISAKDAEALSEIFHEEFQSFSPWDDEPSDKETELANWKANFEDWESMEANVSMTSLVMTAEGESHNMVMCMANPTFVFADAPDKEVSTWIRIDFEVKDGQLYREWVFFDRMHLQSQLQEEE